MVVSPERSAVRTAGRVARQSLSGVRRLHSEAALVSHLQALHAVSDVSSVGAFMAHDGEPCLQPLIDWLRNRGQTVALPVLVPDPADRTMQFVPWHHGEELVSGRYDIPVPPDPDRVATTPETLLVSFTAFDSRGSRMGRGGGFFDRYLQRYNGQIVGVGFEAQRIDHVPVEAHDVGLPVVATDLGVRLMPRKHHERRGNLSPIGKDGRPCE